MKKFFALLLAVLVLSSFYKTETLQGTWQYAGGFSKGKFFEAPKAYKMQRTYTDSSFEANALEAGEPPLRYEAGNYILKADSCLETQTFALQGQQMIGKTVRYQYIIRHDTLVLKGILPNNANIEDYWVKVPTRKKNSNTGSLPY